MASSYQAGWKRWVAYIKGIAPGGRYPGVYLEELLSEADKVDRVVLFLRHLYYDEGKRGDQLGRSLTCVSHMMVVGWCKKRKKGSCGLTEQKDNSDSLFGFEKRPGMHLFELHFIFK
jgi:hypothetical protein